MNNTLFEETRSIVKSVSKSNVNQLEFFSHLDFGQPKNLMTRLFCLMNDDKVKSIEEIEFKLYKSQSGSKSKFKRLYYRFFNKLINTLFFIDTNSPLFIDRAKAYFNCSKRLCAMKILANSGLLNSVLSISEKTLPISHKYEFTELSMQFAKILCQHYSTTFIDKRKFIEYQSKYLQYSYLFEKELILTKISNLISYNINSNDRKFILDHESDEFKEGLELALNCVREDATSEMILNSSKIASYYFTKTKNYEMHNKFNNLFLEKLSTKDSISIVSIENILINQLKMIFVFRDLDAAKNIRDRYFRILNEGNFNWYICYYYYILTLFHFKLYLEAINIVYLLIQNSSFKSKPPLVKEIFYVLEAYSNFLIKINIISIKDSLKEFRLNKFLNQVPIYSKDKQGLNISILLIQILFLLATKDYNKIIDRVESLNLYVYRYLKNDESFRSQCFIRIISEIIKSGFKKQGSIFRTQKLREKLGSVPLNAFPESADIEIIPYEDLWEMVLELLD